jgi:hypothetical protein
VLCILVMAIYYGQNLHSQYEISPNLSVDGFFVLHLISSDQYSSENLPESLAINHDIGRGKSNFVGNSYINRINATSPIHLPVGSALISRFLIRSQHIHTEIPSSNDLFRIN